MKLSPVTTEDFAAMSEKIRCLIEGGQADRVVAAIAESGIGEDEPAYHLLLESVGPYLRGDYARALELLIRAGGLLPEGQRMENSSLYSAMLVNSQLFLPRRERPATGKGYEFYKKNIAALRQEDPVLAGEVQQSAWLGEYVLVEFWDGLYLYSMKRRCLLLMETGFPERISPYLRDGGPITFGGAAECIEEMRYCLRNPYTGVHGKSRAHYLIEECPAWIRVLFHLEDFSEAIGSHKLLLFSGGEMDRRIGEIFSTLLYPRLHVILGNTQLAERLAGPIAEFRSAVPRDAVRAYYQSSEFQQRQQQIARGEIYPRVLVRTCRWTTFLKYCSSDFEKAFRQLGCQTRYLIEKNDAQYLSPEYVWQQLGDFRPDVFFSISHARASAPFLPRELPYICYMQDRCGPLQELPSLREAITGQDLFICLCRVYSQILGEKGVPDRQKFIMPVPVEETLFYPLPPEHPELARYRAEVSFVKHGCGDVKQQFAEFVEKYLSPLEQADWQKVIQEAFTQLFQTYCRDEDRRVYEPELLQFVLSRIPHPLHEKGRWLVEQLTAIFSTVVHSTAWRCQFLQAIREAGIELALYGNDWEKHPQLHMLSRGPVDREKDLNWVYNGSKINLHINHAGTMHQRLVECGLAGGFIMAADHPVEEDWGPARPYFEEGRELVFFDTKKDLVEKCRYYLAYDDQRRQIAANLRKRVLAGHTCRIAAQKVLERWRLLLAAPEQAKD